MRAPPDILIPKSEIVYPWSSVIQWERYDSGSFVKGTSFCPSVVWCHTFGRLPFFNDPDDKVKWSLTLLTMFHWQQIKQRKSPHWFWLWIRSGVIRYRSCVYLFRCGVYELIEILFFFVIIDYQHKCHYYWFLGYNVVIVEPLAENPNWQQWILPSCL